MPKNEMSRKQKLTLLPVMLLLLAFILMILLLLSIYVSDEVEIQTQRSENDFQVIDGVDSREISDPAAPAGCRTIYSFPVDDDLKIDNSLAFYTVHQSVKVFMDGELIYSLQPSGENRLSKAVGCNWVILPLYREDVGKQIEIEITPAYESFRDRQVEFLIGSKLGIYSYRLRKDLPQLILGFLAVFMGVIFEIVAIYTRIQKLEGGRLASLGIFAIMMGLWRLTDTRFTPLLITINPTFVSSLSITMLSIGIIPLIIWAKEYFSEKVQNIMQVYCMLTAVLGILQYVLQFLGIFDIRELLLLSHITIAVGILIIVGSILYEHIKFPNRKRRIIGTILPVICAVGISGDIIIYYVRKTSSGLICSLMTFLLYLVFAGISTVLEYSQQKLEIAEKKRELAEKNLLLAEQEKQLTNRRISVMMSQIRSHFIFNVLTTISSYCKTDPIKADQALIRFSRYLRKNITIIEKEGTITFEVELEQLRDYIALEQMRFGDRISFVEDIGETNFRLPPLTVQPMVENAIKHGLIQPGKEGTIILTTYSEEDEAVIVVEDDGIGFSTESNERKESVGIRNVRERLETMVQGSLLIESKPDEGTKVTIRIPKVRESKQEQKKTKQKRNSESESKH